LLEHHDIRALWPAIDRSRPAQLGTNEKFTANRDFQVGARAKNRGFRSGTNYSVVAGATAWGAGKATALNQLMSYAASNSLPNSQDNSAALQSAVWEVINETTSSYGFTTGSFMASSTGSTQAALTALDAIWANLGTQTVTHYVDQLHSETNQDFLVAAVPEPESYAMLLAGLGIVGAVARRRRSAEA
jgi:hypothetical protein